MTTFTINNENDIVAFGSPEEAAAATTTRFDTFATQQELAELAAAWPVDRFVAIWNSLAGVVPVKKFKNSKTAISRIWDRIQGLGEAAKPAPEPEKPKATTNAKGRAQAAKGAPAKGKGTKKATPAKNAPKVKKAPKVEESAGPREGTKTAQVVAMLQRKGGATLAEIMEKMAWQKHTVRGFMAGAMKKAGYAVESFKPGTFVSRPDPRINDAYRTAVTQQLKAAQANALRLWNAGLLMIAGTDAPYPGDFQGEGIHHELELLVESGLTPIDAISSATRNASRLMKASDDWGTLESGRLADLLVINGRPDQDIRETHNVEMVLKEGVVLNREQLKFSPARDPGFRTSSPVSSVH